jgi:hypothetical protein
MKEMNIDLGEDLNKDPSMPTSVEKGKYFPIVTLHYDEPFDLPKSGEVTFKFKEVEKSQRTDSKGNAEYTCRLELKELVSSEGADEEEGETSEADEKPTKSYDEAGSALDKLAAEKSKSNSEKY